MKLKPMMNSIEDLKANLPEDAFHFVDFPEVIFFDEFGDHVEKLPGAEVKEFEVDGTIEIWLEFIFRDHHFYVNNRFGDYWFFVADPKCPEPVLLEVADHFRKLLEKREEATENTENWER